MTEWPPVTVLVVTYDRPEEVRVVLEALQDKLTYPGELRWHVADDCTPNPNYLPDILRDYPDLNMTYTITPERSGFGMNVNTALRALGAQGAPLYVFQCEDDQVAQRSLDLEGGVFLLENEPAVGLVRYDGIEGHRLLLHLEETLRVGGRREHFLRIDLRKSQGLHVYSHRPHLKHKRFHGLYGGYPESLNLGSTEATFAHHVRMHKGPEIGVLADGIPRAFLHVGKSRQHTEWDVGEEVLFASNNPLLVDPEA